MTPCGLVVDTSALIAVLKREVHWVALRDAMFGLPIVVPAPVLVECRVVARLSTRLAPAQIDAFITEMTMAADIVAFDSHHAAAAAVADARFGKGGGSGVGLNLLDLMVFAIAKVMDLPILCTGKDFAKTDIAIHPASRMA